MSGWSALAGVRLPVDRRVAWTLLGAALVLVVAWPYLSLPAYRHVPLAAAAALVAYLPRRSVAEGLWFALPVVAAHWVEPIAGPAAVACLVLPLHVLTRRPRFAALAGCGLLLLLLVGIRLKSSFAGTRLTWHDVAFFFRQFRDNVAVAASQPTVLSYGALALLAFLAIVGAGWWRDGRSSRPLRWPRAASAALLAIVLVAGSAWVLHDRALAEARSRGAWQLGETPGWASLPISRFLATATWYPAWDTPDVDTAAFRARAGARVGAGGGTRSDIVLFLQETQVNPDMIEGCPPHLCHLPVFDAGVRTVAAGPLRVHIFGAGTWLSEFAVANGLPHTVFGPGGEFAPFNVAPAVRRSFVRSLKAAGYRTVAVYPVRGGMMNARIAYEHYGFDAFYDAVNLWLPGSFHTPDADIHRAALRVLEKERAHGQPVLLLALTIANHGEHGIMLDRVPTALLAEMKKHVPLEGEAEVLADYVWRTGEFAREYEATRRSVLDGPQPAVVAWFGDHQPAFGRAVALRSRVRAPDADAARIPRPFQTWYQVDSNRPAPAALAGVAALDIAFLPGVLAQAAGVPLDDWLSANVTAREECGGLLRECLRPEVRDAYLAHLRRDLGVIALP